MNIKTRCLLCLFVCCFVFGLYAQQDGEKTKIVHDLSKGKFEIKSFDAQSRKAEESAIYFEVENKKTNAGRIILDLSTLNQEDVTIAWQNYSTGAKKARWSVRLQYRLSDTSEWKDVTDARSRPYEFYTGKRAVSRTFSKVVLPSECNNRNRIQISWKYSKLRGKGNDPKISTRNICVSSQTDPYNGAAVELNVTRHLNDKTIEVKKVDFNHIPLPYTYPETIRLKFSGKYLRDSVRLEISGADKEYFSVDSKSIDAGTSPKSVTVCYSPRKAGIHKATLTIKTRKLAKNIIIPLEGSCAKASEFRKNLISNETSAEENIDFAADIFSGKEYQFRMNVSGNQDELTSYGNDVLNNDISVTYKWYRNNVLLKEYDDRPKVHDYCVPLQSPATANKLEIVISNKDRLEIKDWYFGFPKPKCLVRSGNWNDPTIWEPEGEPNMEDFVYIEDSCKVKVTTDVVCSMLVLGDNVNIDINTGKMFYVSGDIVYGNRSYFTVHQNLLSEKWNYISSPVNQARALVYSMRKSGNETWLMKYNTGVVSKHGDHWSEYLMDPNYILQPGHGYAVYTHEDLDVKYEGILCNSKTTVSLTTKNNDKWNLVGNPFTAPLSTGKLFEDIDGKIQGNAIFLFDRENKVYNPIIVDENEEVMIPSLESFFVEAMQDGREITFKRNHQYIPKTGRGSTVNHNYLSLAATVGNKRQYALMGMIDDAKYGFDEYDAHKMFGISEDMPEIYFIVDGEELSVNTFPDYPAAFDIGLYIGREAEVGLRLDNLSVLPQNISVMVEDKYEHKFYDLCLPNKITASLKSGNTNDRYRIYLNKAVNIYEIHPEYSGIYIWNDNGRILVYGDGTHRLQKVRVSDKERNLIEEQEFDSNVLVFDKNIRKGRYTVDIQVEDLWIRDFITDIK